MSTIENWQSAAKYLDLSQLQPGPVMIIAPHQDDESLGCGGTIALLTKLNVPVHLVFVSDGSMSHPNSLKFPVQERIELREKEAIKACEILGVPQNQLTFLRLKDSMLPGKLAPDFNTALQLMKNVLNEYKPATVFLPWRRDPHKDHRATWEITSQAISDVNPNIRKLEYFIWLWERAEKADLPEPNEANVWKVDIHRAYEQKQQAVMAHLSQVSLLIDDDPDGFMLSKEVLAHFDKQIELFIEKH